MADIDVTKLLDPRGPQLQKAARGTPNEARAAVMVHWSQIERAMDAGYTITAIYRVLTDAGLLAISLRSFHRQVQARREGSRGSGTAAKPAGDAQASPALSSAQGSSTAEPSLSARPGEPEVAVKPPAGRRPSWLTEPPPATNRTAVYKPPDPKSTS